MEERNYQIQKFPMSDSLKTKLKEQGIETVDQLLQVDDSRLTNFGLDEKGKNEIRLWENALGGEETSHQKVQETENDGYDVRLSSFEEFSVRATHCLEAARIEWLSDLLKMNSDEIISIKKLGKKTLLELEQFQLKHKHDLIEHIHEEAPCPYDENKVEAYLKRYAVEISNTTLPVRAKRQLEKSGILDTYQLFQIPKNQLLELQNIGKKTIAEIEEFCSRQASIAKKAVIDGVDEFVPTTILFGKLCEAYIENYGSNLDLSAVTEKLIIKHNYSQQEVSYGLSKLIQESKVKITGSGSIHPVLPSILDVIDLVDDDRAKQILMLRIQGRTLEETSQFFSLTRERVRQIFFKFLEEARIANVQSSGTCYFEEGKHRKIFEEYCFTFEQWMDIVGSEPEFDYLKAFDNRGKEDLENSLENEAIPSSLRRKIENCIYKNYAKVDGKYIKRIPVHYKEFILKNYCEKQTSYNEFASMYQKLLEKTGEEKNEKFELDYHFGRPDLSFTDGLSAVSGIFSTFRHYEFSNYDFTHLFEELNLGQYHNTYVTTTKLYEDNPKLMEEYDIQNGYELHNVLRKTIKLDEYPSMKIGRSPSLFFDDFNWKDCLIEIIRKKSPISAGKLAEYIHDEFGVEKQTASANQLNLVREYEDRGIFNAEYDLIADEDINYLKEMLPGDFYSEEEFLSVYHKINPNAKSTCFVEINLKKIGFLPYSGYMIRLKYNVDSFINKTVDEMTVFRNEDIAKYIKFSGVYQTFMWLVNNNLVYRLKERQYITKKHLEKLGITDEKIAKLASDYSLVTQGKIATVEYALKRGLEVEPVIMNFGTYLIGSLIDGEPNYKAARHSSTLIIGSKDSDVSFRGLIEQIVAENGSISVDELMNKLKNEYALTNADLPHINIALGSSKLFFDPIGKIAYENESLFKDSLLIGGNEDEDIN